jgi:hypothetical protein
MREEIFELDQPTTVVALTVRDTWRESIVRHSALLELIRAEASCLCFGNEPGCEELEESEVWRVSKTTIEVHG